MREDGRGDFLHVLAFHQVVVMSIYILSQQTFRGHIMPRWKQIHVQTFRGLDQEHRLPSYLGGWYFEVACWTMSWAVLISVI